MANFDLFVRYTIPGGTPDSSLPKSEGGKREVWKKDDGSEYIAKFFQVSDSINNPYDPAELQKSNKSAMQDSFASVEGATEIDSTTFDTDKASGYTQI